jgi:uncharacterized protein
MRFWDTSALVPLVVHQPATAAIRHELEADPELVCWWGSRVETRSALARLAREGCLSFEHQESIRNDVAALFDAVAEVTPTEAVRARAERCLALHPLRGADALQLGAALVWCRDRTAGVGFVALDDRLRDAARKEGFTVLPR